jgi:hypothetical protein
VENANDEGTQRDMGDHIKTYYKTMDEILDSQKDFPRIYTNC